MTKGAQSKINVYDLTGNFSIALKQLDGDETKTLLFQRADCNVWLKLKSSKEDEQKIIDAYEKLRDMVYGTSSAAYLSLNFNDETYLFRNVRKDD